MATLPTLSRTLNDDFTNTWYEIRADVIDNVTESHIMWLALKEYGCFTPQVGGEYIERTIGYGQKSTQRFSKGAVLEQNVVPADTAGLWNWRYFLVDVNRTTVDDMKNAGKFKIKSYLARRLELARSALVDDSETYSMQWGAYYDGDQQFNGLYDICPLYVAETAVGDGSASDTQATGTSNGGLNRTNAWWRNWVAYDGASESASAYIAGPTNDPFALNLVTDMRHMWNSISNNQESPNFILMSQAMFEAYEDEASDKQQIVQSSFTQTAIDLGFEAFTFKGATCSWSGKFASDTYHLFMLNMNWIEFPYHPNLWFDMTDWKQTPNQLEQVAYIACMTPGMITTQPRRHGSMEYSS